MSCHQKKNPNQCNPNKQTNKYEKNPYQLIYTNKRELIKTGMSLKSYEPSITSAILVWKNTLFNK